MCIHYCGSHPRSEGRKRGWAGKNRRFADGRAHYTEQNGVRKTTHAYGVNPDGAQWTLSAQGALPDTLQTTLEHPNFRTLELLDFPWEIGITDPLGRTISQIRYGYGGALLVTSNFYDTAGRLRSSALIWYAKQAWQNLQIERNLSYELTIA